MISWIYVHILLLTHLKWTMMFRKWVEQQTLKPLNSEKIWTNLAAAPLCGEPPFFSYFIVLLSGLLFCRNREMMNITGNIQTLRMRLTVTLTLMKVMSRIVTKRKTLLGGKAELLLKLTRYFVFLSTSSAFKWSFFMNKWSCIVFFIVFAFFDKVNVCFTNVFELL